MSISGPNWISGRAAARELRSVGLTERAARAVLAAGFAGPPHAVGTGGEGPGRGYRADRVQALVAQPSLDEAAIAEQCPAGLFVSRRPIIVDRPLVDCPLVDCPLVDCPLVDCPLVERRLALQDGWPLSIWTALWLKLRIVDHGPFPFVATVGGFIAVGADIVDVLPDGDTHHLELAAPGAWFDAFTGHRVPTGPGRPWQLLGCRPFQSQASRVRPPESGLQSHPFARVSSTAMRTASW